MRRTIHSDPRRDQRKGRRTTRSVLPSNFQFDLEEKGEELRVKRSSDGQKQQLVGVDDFSNLQQDNGNTKDSLGATQAALEESQEELLVTQEEVKDLRDELDALKVIVAAL